MMHEQFRARIAMLRWAVACIALLLAGRMYWLQVVRGDDFVVQSEKNMIRTIPFVAPRGYMVDRHGEIVVRNVPRYLVTLLPIELKNSTGAIHAITSLVDLDDDARRVLVRTLASNPAEPVKVKKPLDEVTMARIAEIQGDYPGMYIESYPVRDYPLGSVAAHVLGHVGEITKEELDRLKSEGFRAGEVIGKEGLEYRYDRFLRGSEGSFIEQVDAAGRLVKRLGKKPPVAGATLFLTLDAKLQAFAERALLSTLKVLWRKNGDVSGGAVVVLDARSGEVLVMASYPTFDPNLFSRGMSDRQFNEIMNPKTFPMLNRAVGAAYPPGSTFKEVTACAALQERLISPYSTFYCPGYYMVGKHKFNCFVKTGHGAIDLPASIAQSCDTVFYRLGLKLGIERLRSYSAAFGIGSPLGLDLPGESGGFLPGEEWKLKALKEPWYPGDTVNMSIGQGFLTATPLQITAVTAAVSQSGRMFKPFLVRRITGTDGGTVSRFEPECIRTLAIEPEYFRALQQGMRGAVVYGTAKQANSPYVSFAGKTGTAENSRTRENPRGLNHAWFTAFAPSREPEIAVTVFLEKSGEYGGKWAAPIARRIIEFHYGYQRPPGQKQMKEKKKSD